MKQPIEVTGQKVHPNVISFVKETFQRMLANSAASIQSAPGSAAARVDALLDRISGYQGVAAPPRGVTGKLWAALPGVSPSTPDGYIFEHYYVDQQPAGWPSPNECVTASTIQAINMMQDILAAKFGLAPLPHFDLRSFAAMFDAQGLRNWLTRLPAHVPIVGGMLTPADARRVLEAYSNFLRRTYGYGYRAELTAGNTVEDLIENLRKGYPTSIHISQDVKLFAVEDGKVKWDDWRALIGDAPHTVTLAGYDADMDVWLILDPAPKSRWYTRWNTGGLMQLWGRKFIAYPPRFAMTTLIPDAYFTPSASPRFTIPVVAGTTSD